LQSGVDEGANLARSDTVLLYN